MHCPVEALAEFHHRPMAGKMFRADAPAAAHNRH
jgi:hypothetical protein